MGKHGPCYHCGVASTPLWRNGPPEKPVLCNACGSRWRTKGSLSNYTPLHARAETDDFEDWKREVKMLKRKQIYDESQEIQNDDKSNRSSSGSYHSFVRDAMVPSRKRTCKKRPKKSPVEKLTEYLHTILNEQRLHFSESSEEDLIFESHASMVSVEIGHGSVLIRHPSSKSREEESEASSLSVENKPCLVNEACPCLLPLPVNIDKDGLEFEDAGNDNVKRPLEPVMLQEQIKRSKCNNDEHLRIQMASYSNY